MRRDAVVGLVGAAILLVALVGVFRFEHAEAPAGARYVLAPPRALEAYQGSAAQGQAYAIRAQVREPNVTSLEFRLEAPGGGAFTLDVIDLGGRSHQAHGTAPLSVVVNVTAPPENGSAEPPRDAAVGAWNVRITLDEAPQGALPVTPPTAVPVGQEGVAFTLTPYATTWRAG